MRFSKNWLLLLLFVAAVSASLAYAFMPRPVPTDMAAVEYGEIVVTVEEDGRTRIKEKYVVSAPLAGRLARIELKAGDKIEAGKTLLATIEPTDPALLDPREHALARARVRASEAAVSRSEPNLERARAAMEHAEEALTRTRRLFASKAASQEELDNSLLAHRTRTQEFRSATFDQEIARFELEQARAALLRTDPESTKTSESHFEIHAPISGRVLRVIQESATVVTPGAQLLQLGDPDDLEVEVDVLSSDAVRIQRRARAELHQWGGDKPLQATVRLVEPAGFTKISALGVEEQRVNVIIDFNDPMSYRDQLGDGFRVEASIVTWENPRVLRVPTSALFRQQQDWAVFRVTDERAHVQVVEIGRQNGLMAEVVKGLDEHDHVVIHPSDKITEGTEVAPR